MTTLRCAHCNDPLPPQPKGPGRRRVYCGDRCKDAAYRVRMSSFEPMPQPPMAEPTDEVGLLLAGRPTDTDAVLAAALLQSQALSSAFLRLSKEARPPFHWRCLGMGQAIQTALARYFEEAVK